MQMSSRTRRCFMSCVSVFFRTQCHTVQARNMNVVLYTCCLGLGIPPIGRYDSIRTAPFHPSIHTLGNVGHTGRVHARGAWFATWIIDQLAYNGRNMRCEFAQLLASNYENRTSLLEVGCGVGTLTYELERTQKFNIVGIDTSNEMISVAKQYIRSPLVCMNGVDFRETVDVSVICMVLHEMPLCAHRDMINHMMSVSVTDVWIIDIDPGYQPSRAMLSGEPYMPEYMETIEKTIESIVNEKSDTRTMSTFPLISGHVRVWRMSDH